MPIEVQRVPSLSVPEPERAQGSVVGPAATETPAIPLGISRRSRIRNARVYLTTLATGAPGGPVAANALNPTALALRSDGVTIGTLNNAAGAIADGAAIAVSAADLDAGEHIDLYIDNTPAGAENWSALRVTCVLELDPR